MSSSNSARYCSKCQKAQKMCICRFINQIDCDIPIIILQHTSEAKHAKNTAKILQLSLSHCSIFTGENFSENTQLNQIINSNSHNFAVLFPSDKAIDIQYWQANEQQKNKKLGLILLDGTWKKAYKIYQLSTNIQHLPCVSLSINTRSQYRIRKTNKEGGLSTLEAGYFALSTMKGSEQNYQGLIKAFDLMVDLHLAQIPEELRKKHYK